MDDDLRTLMRGECAAGACVLFLIQFTVDSRTSLSDCIDDFRTFSSSRDVAASVSEAGDLCASVLQLLSSSFVSFFFFLVLPRRSFKLDFLDGRGDAAVIFILIFSPSAASCCSSSPDCSTHVDSKLADPVCDIFIGIESLVGSAGVSIADADDDDDAGRSRRNRSSSAFNEPSTDGGVK